MLITDPPLQPLLAAYRQLAPWEQYTLRLLSVLYVPSGMSKIREMLKALRLQDDQGKDPTDQIHGRWEQRLRGLGLLEPQKPGLRCRELIAEVLSREAVQRGEFTKMRKITELREPPPSRLRGYSSSLEHYRALRSLLLANDLDGFRKLMLEADRCDSVLALYADYYRCCDTPFDAAWFDQLFPDLRWSTWNGLMYAKWIKLQPAGYLLDYARTHVDELLKPGQFDGRGALLAYLLLAGKTPEFSHDAQDLPYLGWSDFLQGRDETAVGHYQQALQLQAKASRKRQQIIYGVPGIFYLLALLRHRPSGWREAFEKEVRGASKLSDPLSPAKSALHNLMMMLDGEIQQQRLADWLEIAQPRGASGLAKASEPYDIFLLLVVALAYAWTGTKPETGTLGVLAQQCDRAYQAGWLWYAAELDQLLRGWGCMDRLPEALPLQGAPLRDLIKPEPAWLRMLRALREIPAQQAATPALRTNASRMTWWISGLDANPCLYAKEQRLSKNGSWSAGRVVALKRLLENPEDFAYLTLQDQRICATIELYQTMNYYGYYTKEYQLCGIKAFRAALGHPLLFLDGPTMGPPLELVEVAPVLRLQQLKRGLKLQLAPPPLGDLDWRLEAEGEHRLRLVQFDASHLRIARILGANGLEVPSAARHELLTTVSAIAPLLSIHSDIDGVGAVEAEEVEPDRRLWLALQPIQDGLELEFFVRPLGAEGPRYHPAEGGASLYTEVAERRLRTTRDLPAERQTAVRLLAACTTLDPEQAWHWQLPNPEVALETLSQLQTLGDELVMEWPKGRPLRVSREHQVQRMSLAVNTKRDWFSLEGGLQLDDGRVLGMKQLLDLLDTAPGRFLRLGEDEFLALSEDLKRRLEAIKAYSEGGLFHPLHAPVMNEALEDMELKSSAAWRAQLKHLGQAEELDPQVPGTLQAELREYQVEGYRWLTRLAHWGAGACLADDMGLGKTLQALALLLSRAPDGPALVLAPTSVCANWIDEARRFAPTLRPQVFGAGDREQMLNSAGPYDLIVCSYGLLQSEDERLAKVTWHSIVADEAQAIKNAQTKRSAAAMALQSPFRMITTGTPIENHLGELWNLFRFINPGLLGSQERFNRQFATPIEQQQDASARQRLKRLIRPFVLRRIKSQVLSDLPSRTEITLHVELSPDERLFYEALRRQAMERLAKAEDEQPGQRQVQVLAEIMRLRRGCCNPRLVLPEISLPSAKLETFGEVVSELLDNRHKALVFSQFVDHLRLIREYLDAQGINYQYLDGSTPVKQRQLAVNAFQAGKGELFLISLKAGGSGLNLTAADYVIHMDPWWNPAVEDQASDRAHRLGQQRPVTIYRLVARDTIEERIVNLHARKRDLADSLLEGTESGGKMSLDEMMALLRD